MKIQKDQLVEYVQPSVGFLMVIPMDLKHTKENNTRVLPLLYDCCTCIYMVTALVMFPESHMCWRIHLGK